MTTDRVDLGPAVQRLADIVRGVRDEQLGAPTPCPAYSLADLLDHVEGLAGAFTAAARKAPVEGGPTADGSRLGDGWRDRIPAALDGLAAAWREPEAWTGMTRVGGVDLPGEACGLVALDEVVVHAWDVARASGQPYDVDPASLAAIRSFVAQFDGSGTDGLFGPAVPVPDDAPLLDQVIGLTGRDPSWSPATR